MSIQLSINTILREENIPEMKIGEVYNYSKNSLRFLTDNMPIWLCQKDWTPVAEVQVLEQTRGENGTSCKYKVLYIYNEEEAKVLKSIFVRMYGELF